jgi:hypothetical protein
MSYKSEVQRLRDAFIEDILDVSAGTVGGVDDEPEDCKKGKHKFSEVADPENGGGELTCTACGLIETYYW